MLISTREGIRALLCDFGLAKTLDEVQGLTTASDEFRGTISWCSPELLDNSPRTSHSDMWAWGLLCLGGKFRFVSSQPPLTYTYP